MAKLIAKKKLKGWQLLVIGALIGGVISYIVVEAYASPFRHPRRIPWDDILEDQGGL